MFFCSCGSLVGSVVCYVYCVVGVGLGFKSLVWLMMWVWSFCCVLSSLVLGSYGVVVLLWMGVCSGSLGVGVGGGFLGFLWLNLKDEMWVKWGFLGFFYCFFLGFSLCFCFSVFLMVLVWIICFISCGILCSLVWLFGVEDSVGYFFFFNNGWVIEIWSLGGGGFDMFYMLSMSMDEGI